ncbi:peptide chain release factor N(5)-glutamine methyltransferase [Thalassospiraceae bacterium LMO-JJ14]|nr:peptide chain release factor N(5)-glutamine methyltransferase [Thalassospiraceae bacterium LMO-JJ14]
MTTIGSALDEALKTLKRSGIENARMEARLLLAHILGLSRAQVFNRINEDADDAGLQAFHNAVRQRATGTPLAHITGKREFWSLDFQVSPATLIPRPDTETVIELALEIYKERPYPKKILDLGTGSGCILMGLLTCFPEATGCGMDISEEACRIACSNAHALGLDPRCEIIEATWASGINETYDLIVSNPPYIPSADIGRLERDVRDHEPLSALDGGADGLDAYRELLPLAEKSLAGDGVLIVEVGIGQAADVLGLATHTGLLPGPAKRDIAGIERAISFCKKGVGIPGATG